MSFPIKLFLAGFPGKKIWIMDILHHVWKHIFLTLPGMEVKIILNFELFSLKTLSHKDHFRSLSTLQQPSIWSYWDVAFHENYFMCNQEKTKIWNLFRLFTPTSWMWTFISIGTAVTCLKLATFIGTKFGMSTFTEEITLFPYR